MSRNVERSKLADDAKLVMDAVVLIRLGARLPMLQSEVATVTRAWMLVRFIDGAVLDTVRCVECGARFIAYCHDVRRQPRCVGCHLPARAGKRAHACATDLRGGRTMQNKNPPHPGKRSG
ncbi:MULTISPECIES: FlhC family transcriptional regulator [unclassified Burkholderia]|uniref:FlhC family transcriptional regulator n=1 Tax=unclassified Burkholderia TaxID=2613784 RepID=UPI000757F0F2|nr:MULTISPECIES: FlhC family transcriptional regulator [unclassified Burkholderia]KUY98492.1 hypothetical protein WS48_12225 [Burkholderia sp. RF7-non_BP1]KUZ02826.1 hypothetical protein WS49_12955 [Burkholderia sp. RF7-non_BP4]